MSDENNKIDYELYRTEHYRYQSLHEKNLINQENAMITLSIGLLAALTALGEKLIVTNTTLAVLAVIALSLTIIHVVVGYYLSNIFFGNHPKFFNFCNTFVYKIIFTVLLLQFTLLIIGCF